MSGYRAGNAEGSTDAVSELKEFLEHEWPRHFRRVMLAMYIVGVITAAFLFALARFA